MNTNEYNELKEYIDINLKYLMRGYLEDFEDIFIDSMIVLLEKYDISKNTSKKTFLYTIVKNKCLTFLKNKRYTDNNFDNIVDEDIIEEKIKYNMKMNNILLEIDNVVLEMNERYRRIYILYFIENKNYEYILDVLDINNIQKLKNYIFQIRKTIKEKTKIKL